MPSASDPLLFIRACVLASISGPLNTEPTQEQLDLVEPFRAELKAALDQLLPGPGYIQKMEVRDRGRKLIESVRSALRRIWPQTFRVQFNDAVWEQARAFEGAWSRWGWRDGLAYRRRTPHPCDLPAWQERYIDWRYRGKSPWKEGVWNPPGT